MVNLRLCETARPLFKNPRPNYKSSRLRDRSTCSEPEVPRFLFRMPRFRDWTDIFRDALFSYRPFYTPSYGLMTELALLVECLAPGQIALHA